MKKRYICFACYGFHPEMRGISEAELTSETNFCSQEKCTCFEDLLKEAFYCETCDQMLPWDPKHKHIDE